MQATSGNAAAQPSPQMLPALSAANASRLPECLYQVATVVVILLLLWSVA